MTTYTIKGEKELRRKTLYRILMLLAACMLTGCSGSSDESDSLSETQPAHDDGEKPQQHLLGFTAHFADSEANAASRLTRATGDGELTTELLQAKGFGVYCWYTGTDIFNPASNIRNYTKSILMLNQHVTYSGGQWNYSPSKYWPLADNENLTFRAYAPYVSYNLQTNEHGMPMLPVVVDKDDYQNGTQHDPLWGTGKHGGTDDEETTYGLLYDNYNYERSGDLIGKDSRDGTIHWYFHHGMSKLMFACSVIADPGCESVTITSITITPLYNQGLLSLSSATASSSEKPTWEECDGEMTVTIDKEHLASYPNPLKITTKTSEPTAYVNLLEKGLLIIPRNFTSSPMSVTVKYKIDDEPDELEAVGTIPQQFDGNTSYTLGLSLTPSTKGLEITIVHSAFTDWQPGGTGTHAVYNW